MTELKKLLLANIQAQCDHKSFERGRIYYQLGHVLNMQVLSEGTLFTQLKASVQGSDVIAYKQNIRITWRDTDYRIATIHGDCTCPAGGHCKHVVAVCLNYQQQLINALTGANCLDWLDELNIEKLSETLEFIAYLLKPHPLDNNNLTVEIIVTKQKKSGLGLNKGRRISLSNLPYSKQSLDCFQTVDDDISKLLIALDSSPASNMPTLVGEIGFFTMQKLLKTGRLYWQDGTRPALTSGEIRDLKFDWTLAERGCYRLSHNITPEAILILTDPPQYLDTKNGTVGGFKQTITLKQLKKYLSAPTVPEAHADEFSMQLVTKQSDMVLPPPKPVAMTELQDATPIPKLRLFGKTLANHCYQHLLAINFVYQHHVCHAKKIEPYQVLRTTHGLLRIKRQVNTEQQAITQLNELGFQAIEHLGTELWLCHHAAHALEAADYWNDFLQNVIPELQQRGWLIDIEESFKLNFQTLETWHTEISDSQHDWFEMRFHIDINGKSYPLLPLIAPVLENYALDVLPEVLHLHLGDYQYLSIASEKIKPILAILLELFNTSHLNADGSLKLSRFNVANLADLEQYSCYGLFSLTGGERLREIARKLRDFSGISPAPLPNNFQATLRPYQQQGLNWLQFLREYQFGGILADDMGLGKTIQTLAHLLLEKQSGRMTEPSLIVAPTSLMSNWRREAQRFAPDLTVLILQGTERKQHFDKINDYDLVLTTYPLLPRDEDTLLQHRYHYLVLDEAQTVKNPSAIAAQIVRQIKAKHRLCLTGTPMENHLGELWSQFDFLMPNFLGNSAYFKRNYRTPIESFNDAEKKIRLARRIAPFMLRRTKQAVAAELPAKTEIIRTVALHANQATLYETIRLTMEQRVKAAIEAKGLARSHITILDALLKLRQTCCDPRTLSLNVAKKVHESAKLDLLMDILPEQLEEGRRILVFSQFTRMIALIEQELLKRDITYTKLTGQTQQRDAAIEQFKSGIANVFLISLKAGGVGLNLTEADTVIIYDPWWNPAAESQAIDRAYRIGQDKPVFVYKLVTENTVEEKILAMQEQKRALAASIYSDEAGEEFSLSADDLTDLFAPLH